VLCVEEGVCAYERDYALYLHIYTHTHLSICSHIYTHTCVHYTHTREGMSAAWVTSQHVPLLLKTRKKATTTNPTRRRVCTCVFVCGCVYLNMRMCMCMNKRVCIYLCCVYTLSHTTHTHVRSRIRLIPSHAHTHSDLICYLGKCNICPIQRLH
jgi:hypothetical protein